MTDAVANALALTAMAGWTLFVLLVGVTIGFGWGVAVEWRYLKREIRRLQEIVSSLAARCANQSDALAHAAERRELNGREKPAASADA